MSTPPFIAIPHGVASVEPPTAPLPALVAEPAGAGPVPGRDLLLVPGFTGSKEDFIALVRPLAGRGWRVAAVDLPGQNGAAALGGPGSHTPGALAEALVRFLDWFAPGRPAHVVGHSMGGLVTRELLLRRPDLIASWVPMSSGPAAIPEPAWPSLRTLQRSVELAPLSVIYAEKEAADRAAGWFPPSEEVGAWCARRFEANDPAALVDFAQLLMTAPDLTDDLAAAARRGGIRLGVVAGELDDAWPAATQREMARRLGARWIELPEIGHNPAVEDPAATADAITSAILGPEPQE